MVEEKTGLEMYKLAIVSDLKELAKIFDNKEYKWNTRDITLYEEVMYEILEYNKDMYHNFIQNFPTLRHEIVEKLYNNEYLESKRKIIQQNDSTKEEVVEKLVKLIERYLPIIIIHSSTCDDYDQFIDDISYDGDIYFYGEKEEIEEEIVEDVEDIFEDEGEEDNVEEETRESEYDYADSWGESSEGILCDESIVLEIRDKLATILSKIEGGSSEELESLRKENNALKEQLKSNNSDDTLQEDLESIKLAKQRLEEELNTLKDTINNTNDVERKYEEELEKFKIEKDEFEKILSDKEEEITKLNSTIQDVVMDKEVFKQKYDELLQIHESYKDESEHTIASLNNSVSVLELELSEVKESHNNQENDPTEDFMSLLYNKEQNENHSEDEDYLNGLF